MRTATSTLPIQLGSQALRYCSPLVRGGTDSANGAIWRISRTAHGRFDGTGHADTRSDGEQSDHGVDELARLEAVLFLAREPLSTRKLAQLAGLADGTKARSLVSKLRRRLQSRASAVEPVEVAGGIQLLTRPQLGDWLSRQYGRPGEPRLSSPAMETLAVAAYRQPVLRAEIEAVRGVQCGELLKVLMERDLLRIVGRSEELGRPYLYGTTRKFLQVFGLQRLEQLPPIDQTLNPARRAVHPPGQVPATGLQGAPVEESAAGSIETETAKE